LALKHGPARDLVPFGRVPVEDLSLFTVGEFATCVVPRLPWGVQMTRSLCGYTNTCSLDSFLSLIFIATRNPNGMHRQLQETGAMHEDSLLGKAMVFLEQNQPNEARRLIYEAHPNVKWPEGADITHNAWSNVGARAGSLLCGEGTRYTVSREVVCGACSNKLALENQTKTGCNMSAASIDETSLVEDVFQQFLSKPCSICNAAACLKLEMQDAPKELLVLDLVKGTNPKKNGPAQLFTTIPHRFVWKETVFSFVGVIMGNDVHFISVNRLHDSYVMYDGQKGGRHEQHSLTNAKPLAEKLQSEGYTVRWALFERVPIVNYMDENTIERVRDFVRATKIQY